MLFAEGYDDVYRVMDMSETPCPHSILVAWCLWTQNLKRPNECGDLRLLAQTKDLVIVFEKPDSQSDHKTKSIFVVKRADLSHCTLGIHHRGASLPLCARSTDGSGGTKLRRSVASFGPCKFKQASARVFRLLPQSAMRRVHAGPERNVGIPRTRTAAYL